MPTIEGPEGPIAFERDELGYPRIGARDRAEAMYARGWLHATDRLTQVAITLMVAEGRMMELLGDEPFARTFTRLLHLVDLDGGLDEQVERADGRDRRLMEAYCDGFNSAANRRRWPYVLEKLGVAVPELTPRDSLLLYRFLSFFGLTSFQLTDELVVAELVADGADDEVFEMLLGEAVEGLDLEALEGLEMPEQAGLLSGSPPGGSNAVAVDARRSAAEGALLMADPHLEIGRFPPAIYIAHERYEDGEYAQGMYIPGIPWLFIGRTPHVGWTYTFAAADNVDVLVERCRDGEFLADGEWKPLRRREVQVGIRGAEDETWVFHDNDYGTIPGEASEGDLPCVRWAGLHDSTIGDVQRYFDFAECRNVRELTEAVREIETVAMNGIFADSAGSIARASSGIVDRRPEGWSGAYPRKAWDLEGRDPEPADERARPATRIDPESGAIVSANQRTLGEDGSLWCDLPHPPYRYERIKETIGACDDVDLDDLVAAVMDETDLSSRRMLATWGPMLPDEPLVDELCRWAETHGRELDDRGREMMGLAHALHHEVGEALLATRVGEEHAERMTDELGMLLNFRCNFDDVLAGERPELVDSEELGSLVREAWPRARERAQSEEWHVPVRARFENHLTEGALPGIFGFSSPEMTFPGGPTSPFQSTEITFEEPVLFGAAGRMVFDMSEEGSWYHIPGGASEHRLGPGYGAGVDAWREGTFYPLGEADWFDEARRAPTPS